MITRVVSVAQPGAAEPPLQTDVVLAYAPSHAAAERQGH